LLKHLSKSLGTKIKEKEKKKQKRLDALGDFFNPLTKSQERDLRKRVICPTDWAKRSANEFRRRGPIKGQKD